MCNETQSSAGIFYFTKMWHLALRVCVLRFRTRNKREKREKVAGFAVSHFPFPLHYIPTDLSLHLFRRCVNRSGARARGGHVHESMRRGEQGVSCAVVKSSILQDGDIQLVRGSYVHSLSTDQSSAPLMINYAHALA